MIVELPYGRRGYRVDFGPREVDVVRAAAPPPPPALDVLLARALDEPLGRARLSADSRVTIVVSDPARDEPRAAFVDALRRRLPTRHLTLAIATGTHGPCRLDDLGIARDVLRNVRVVNHDGARSDDLVDLGTSPRGTPVRVHRCVIEADLVVATGCIRPHYFAGFGAGAKAIFPGLGDARAIRINHRLKVEPGARAGVVVGNPCRDDIEGAVARVTTPKLLVNGVCSPDGAVRDLVCGDIVEAFRRGCELARPWFSARSRRAELVIASDALPITATLYQSAKIAAAAAPVVAPGGVLVVVAECAGGTGPLDVVNDAIFRTGVLPRLPADARLYLVSELSPDRVAETLLQYASTVDQIVAKTSGRIVVLPNASQLLLDVEP